MRTRRPAVSQRTRCNEERRCGFETLDTGTATEGTDYIERPKVRHWVRSGAVLTPSVEVGVRHDGGDAEIGFGVDIGGGLA